MPETSSDAFLQGKGIPVPLARIDATLEDLWGPAVERAGGPQLEHPTTTRVVLANLVVERLTPETGAMRPVIETVVGRFPCRAIVIRESDDPDRKVAAEVSAMRTSSEAGASRVGSERIVLRAGPGGLDLLPNAVRSLLETGLPMILWWTTDPTAHEKLYRDLAAESSRVMLDLPDPGASFKAMTLGLDPSVGSCVRDTIWYSLNHWRELIARLFDHPDHQRTPGRIRSVTIASLSPDPAAPARHALWLGAWLAGQLGWERNGIPALTPDGAGSIFKAAFRGPAGPVSLEVQTGPMVPELPPTPRIMAVSLTAAGDRGEESYELHRPSPTSPDVRIHVAAEDYCRLPSTVHAETPTPARRLAAALEFSRFDPPYEKGLPFLLWFLEHARTSRP